MSPTTETSLRAELAMAEGADEYTTAAAQARIDDILRPAGGLARLDDIAVWLAGWQRTATPSVDHPVAIIFAADHGVVTEGVSAYPAEVTGAMLAAFQKQKASVSAMASVSGTAVYAIDVGVGKPTGNLRVEPAMSRERFEEAFTEGRRAVAEHCQSDHVPDLFVFGEMGIGNTTAAAAVAAGLSIDSSLIGRAPHESEYETTVVAQFVGRGTGVGDDEHRNKVQVVADGLNRYRSALQADTATPVSEVAPLSLLEQLGGTELVAIAGAMVEARLRSVPVLLDGYIATIPAAVLHAIAPTFVDNVRAGHVSAEPGHRHLLNRMGLVPLLDLDMRLGEASGAVAAVPLVQMACKLMTEVPTFSEWFGTQS